jgi:beta-glucuronidase
VIIREASINRSIKTDNYGYAKFNFPAKLNLWSPDNPKLYDVLITSETDTVRDKIGFRNIDVMGSKIFLNGKEIFLRGICAHEEAPYRNGRAYSKQDADTLLGWAKELGCNFMRLAHYPHNENMIREAERMGILLWSEIPVYWTIQWQNSLVRENASNQLTEMISRDKNRAPIILWSIANETPRSDDRLLFLKTLSDEARLADSTRLITAATETHYINPNTIMIDDPLGKYLDVLGCNEYIGWYDGLPQKADTINWKTVYDKPLIISEFGGDAKYGLHGDSLTRWSEEYQENLYTHQINMLGRIPFLQGTAPWILMDFRSPRRPLPGIQDFFNRKGLISNKGEKKKAFYVLRNFYKSISK